MTPFYAKFERDDCISVWYITKCDGTLYSGQIIYCNVQDNQINKTMETTYGDIDFGKFWMKISTKKANKYKLETL